jgi:type I restriction enzyme R subunit
MTNFAFLPADFKRIANAARQAESHILGDPRAACFHTRKARVIQKVGNLAVHSPRPVSQADAMQVVKELHHICYWLVRTYQPNHLHWKRRCIGSTGTMPVCGCPMTAS